MRLSRRADMICWQASGLTGPRRGNRALHHSDIHQLSDGLPRSGGRNRWPCARGSVVAEQRGLKPVSDLIELGARRQFSGGDPVARGGVGDQLKQRRRWNASSGEVGDRLARGLDGAPGHRDRRLAGDGHLVSVYPPRPSRRRQPGGCPEEVAGGRGPVAPGGRTDLPSGQLPAG